MNMFKTTTAKTPEEYIEMLEEPRKSDIKRLHEMILKYAPNMKPHIMSGMLAYGKYPYKSKTGRQGEWMPIALASQKNYISLYVCATRDGASYLTDEYREKLPKADIGKSCVRFKKVADVDEATLQDMVKVAAELPAIGQV
jgi:hypothetical protein